MIFIKKLSIILPIAIIAIYFLISLFFNNAFLPNTYINNQNYGWKTVSEAEFKIKNNTKPNSIELIKNDGLTETVNLEKLDCSITINSDLNEIFQSQNSFTWIINLFQKNYYNADITMTYDENSLYEIISNLKCVTTQKASAPQNAYVEKTENGYEIIPETEGSLINKDALKTAIIYAIENNITTIDLSKENCYEKAEITTESDSIKEIENLLNNIENLVIVYDFDDRTETLDTKTINSWISIEGTDITVDEEKAIQYVTNLAYKYDTYQTEREFTTSAGNTITVSGGIYGWQTDVSKTTEELIAAIKQCESTTLEPVYKISGFCRKENDIGNTYVEISIDEQHMWYYKDGELIVETDVVTGLPNGKRDTPKGVFSIWSRETDRYLGTMADEGYSSFVHYWMPIDWTGVGIHDASWRSNFGGNIYKSNGSHGCINTPSDAVEKIFNNCKTGTPVVIY